MRPVIWFALALVATLTCQHTYAQNITAQADAGITSNRVIGELKAIDSAGKQITVKTDASSLVTVTVAESTGYSRIPPGATTLDKVTKITFADLGVGDRILAVGQVADDHKSATARTLVVISKGDIAKKNEAERLEWRRRGILGVVSAITPDKREVTVTTRNAMGTQTVVMAVPENVDMRRYAPDSTKFGDAKPSVYEDLKVGDQLRAMGNKNADGTHLTAEKIVSGSFRMAVGTVTAVDPATNEVKINDVQTKHVLTVVVKPDSVMRQFPSMAQITAAQTAAQAAAQAAAAKTPAPKPAAGASAPANGQAKAGGPPPGVTIPSMQEMLDRLPLITVAQIKPGDIIIVSSTNGVDPSRLTAITLINGADTLLALSAPKPGGAVPNPTAGLGTGVTFGIGLP